MCTMVSDSICLSVFMSWLDWWKFYWRWQVWECIWYFRSAILMERK
jgi:hypothetical protein